ncbi:hypothetical protein KIW84_011003 [Lathyrus oleraceus]|uniref:Uncharacterized protein n=1 Tax=Pisum sativum TaxID=3888 RepID=A0A9D5BEK4_PEA|nr:hypothetical protein KIW84_011003 [Pisum sativum]
MCSESSSKQVYNSWLMGDQCICTVSKRLHKRNIEPYNYIENGNDKGFVETEWLKHGTCSLNKFTQIEYLQLALDIKNSISLIDVLKNANIVPHKTATYDISDIVRAIKTSHPNEPTLMCKMDPNPRNVIPYLQEIRLCFEDNGITPRNCPGNTRIMCINKNSNNKVFFPA